MKITKLDARHTGWLNFQYYVNFNTVSENDTFCNVRDWCWETWGSSTELEIYQSRLTTSRTKNEHWCWAYNDSRNQSRIRIYLCSEEDLVLFSLRWL